MLGAARIPACEEPRDGDRIALHARDQLVVERGAADAGRQNLLELWDGLKTVPDKNRGIRYGDGGVGIGDGL